MFPAFSRINLTLITHPVIGLEVSIRSHYDPQLIDGGEPFVKRFGQTVRQTLIGFTALTMLLACNREPDTSRVSGDVKVRIPFPLEGGGYSLQVIGLSGIASMYEFHGDQANFYIYPSTDGVKLHGARPKAHFIKAGDIFVPTAEESNLTQQMAVIYAHMQRLRQLDAELGLGELNQGPSDIGMMVRFPSRLGYGMEVNNAFYLAETDAILIVPYTENELPLAVNGGILAHEHFHSLYYKLVGKQLSELSQAHGYELLAQVQGAQTLRGSAAKEDGASLETRTNRMIYLGLNEGLADFWAFIYTGDAEFMTPTVPGEESVNRSLKLSAAQVKDLSVHRGSHWQSEVQQTPDDKWPIYTLGTEFAKSMTAFTGVVQTSRGLSSLEARKLVAKALVQTLPSLALKMKALSTNQVFEPADFLNLLGNSMADIKPVEKAFLNGVVTRSMGVQAKVTPVIDTTKIAATIL